MPTTTLRFLAVEDDKLQARALRQLVQDLGYEMAGIADSADEAVAMFDDLEPDLVLLDIRLRGDADGVDLALRLNQRRAVPLIFLTSSHDRSTFERAKAAGPFAFLTKPYDEDALARAIELAVQHYAVAQGGPATANPLPDGAALVPGALYVRENNRLLKVHFDDILWLEADDSYVHLHAVARKYTVRVSLRELEEKLPPNRFVRVRRGMLVQAACIESVDLKENQVWVRGHSLAIGRTCREELLKRLNLVG